MKIEMTRDELAEFLSKNENSLTTLYRYLLTDIDAVRSSGGFLPPYLPIGNVGDANANAVRAVCDMRRIAEICLTIIETLDFICDVIESDAHKNKIETEKPENTNE